MAEFGKGLMTMPRGMKRLATASVDFVLMVASMLAVVTLRFEGAIEQLLEYLPLGLAGAALGVASFWGFGLYREILRYTTPRVWARLAMAMGLATVLLVAGCLLVGPRSVSRPVLLGFGLISLFACGGMRLAASALLSGRGAGISSGSVPVIIYGAGASGVGLAAALSHSPFYRPIGFIDDDPRLGGSRIRGLRVHMPSELSLVRSRHPDAVVALAIPSASSAERRRVLDRLRPLGLRLMTVPGLRELMVGEAGFGQLRELRIEDLLNRDLVEPDSHLLGLHVTDRNVLVSGAGGSIGGELCRQIIRLKPRSLVLLDQSEFSLYRIEQELAELTRTEPDLARIEVRAALGSVNVERAVECLLRKHSIETIYHAAAYKHVSMVETNEIPGIVTNAFGTSALARAALRCGVATFVMISTDKAVRPSNVMGASKRLAELVILELARGGWRRSVHGTTPASGPTRFAIVRFGNVLGSSGSVVPKFLRQIARGGPVTVTHPEVTRFFMTIPEAVNLVIQAGSLAESGDILILDMGQPVRIVDLARNLIALQGMSVRDESRPDGDIAIEYTGLLPGEKLNEELVEDGTLEPTSHPKIGRALRVAAIPERFLVDLGRLQSACEREDVHEARAILAGLVSAPEAASD